jgi:glutamyl-tRNA reductase
MSLLVLGLNHQKTPIEIRERFAFTPHQVKDALGPWRDATGASELVMLSTCNRTELYLSHDNAREAEEAALAALEHRAELPLDAYCYRYEDAQAIRHLFRVASGLDSMVLGENEVLGQVKQAYLLAQKNGCTAKLMNVLFQRSLYVGKRVRTDTGLSMGAGSIGSVAVSLAERIFESLAERTVMILGAGKMAELTARHLLSQKVRALLVSNRTFERAQELAQELGGEAVTFEAGLQRMEEADIVLCSTAAPHPIIRRPEVEALMERRRGRSLFFIDIAVPRDVHPDVHAIDNVYVYNIDDLQTIVRENADKRVCEIRAAEAIVEEKTAEFSAWFSAYLAGQEHSLQHGAHERLSAVHDSFPHK